MTKRPVALIAAAAMMFALLAGCTKKEEPAPAPEPVPADTAAPTEPTDGETLTVTAENYSFDAPTELAAGTYNLELVNNGTDMHESIIVELLDGKTMEDALAYIETSEPDSPPPPWARIAAFAFAEPGLTEGGMPANDMGKPEGRPGTPIELTAGSYGIFCFIPEGSTSRESEPAEGAKPHVALGMYHELTVT